MNQNITQMNQANPANSLAAGQVADNILRGAFRPAFSARLARLWSAYKLWRNRQIAVRELRRMPDALLRDIGIERWQIRDVVYGSHAGATHAEIFRATATRDMPQTTPQTPPQIPASSRAA